MIKRLLVGVLCLSLLLCSAVNSFAAGGGAGGGSAVVTNNITNAEDGELVTAADVLTVEGELSKAVANNLVNLWITDNAGKLIYVGQTRTNADGEYSFSVGMDIVPLGGVFGVKTIAEVGNACPASFTYYLASEVGTAEGAVVSAAGTGSVAQALIDNKGQLGFSNPAIKEALSGANGDVYAAQMEAYIEGTGIVIDGTNVAAVLNEAALVNNIQNAESADDIKDAIALSISSGNVLGLGTNDVYTKYTASSSDEFDYDELTAMLAESEAQYATKASLVNGFKAAGATAEMLDVTETSEIAAILEDPIYNGCFNLTVYNQEGNDKTAVAAAIIAAAEEGALDSADDVQAILNTVISGGGDGGDDDDDDVGGGGGDYFVSRVEGPLVEKDPFDDTVKLPSEVKVFEDMQGYDWAAESVENLKKLGIISGYSATRFAPEMPLTRAELSKMICGIFGYTQSKTDAGFDDVKADAWYSGYVWKMKEMGIVNGVTETSFAPESNITREDAFTIIYRIIGRKYADDTFTAEFSDAADVSDYAIEAAVALVQSELVKGDNGRINPKNTLTRAETAVLLDRLYKLINQ